MFRWPISLGDARWLLRWYDDRLGVLPALGLHVAVVFSWRVSLETAAEVGIDQIADLEGR